MIDNFGMLDVRKNTIYLTGAYTLQKILAFFYFALIARFLNPDLVGKYAFVLSFTAIFSIFLDLGLNPILIREVSKKENKSNLYLNNIITLKIILSFLVYSLLIIVINLLKYPSLTKNLVYLAGLAMVFESFSVTFFSIFRGLQNLKYEGLGIIIYQVILVSLGTLALIFKKSVLTLIFIVFLATLFYFFYSLILIYKKSFFKIYFNLKKDIILSLLSLSSPFLLANLLNKLYYSFDIVLISKLISDEATGFYSVSHKLVFALIFIPSALGAAIFPIFSNLFLTSKEKLTQAFQKSFFYLFTLSLPLTLGGIFLAKEIIHKVYGDVYSPSILSLKILISSLVFLFLNFSLGAILNASERQKIQTRNLAIATLTNIVLNLILIPNYSFIGASVSLLISESLLFFLGLIEVSKFISYDKKYLIEKFSKVLFSAVIMAILIFYLKSYLKIIFLIPLAAFSYFLVLFLIKGLKREEIKI